MFEPNTFLGVPEAAERYVSTEAGEEAPAHR